MPKKKGQLWDIADVGLPLRPGRIFLSLLKTQIDLIFPITARLLSFFPRFFFFLFSSSSFLLFSLLSPSSSSRSLVLEICKLLQGFSFSFRKSSKCGKAVVKPRSRLYCRVVAIPFKGDGSSLQAGGTCSGRTTTRYHCYTSDTLWRITWTR